MNEWFNALIIQMLIIMTEWTNVVHDNCYYYHVLQE